MGDTIRKEITVKADNGQGMVGKKLNFKDQKEFDDYLEEVEKNNKGCTITVKDI